MLRNIQENNLPLCFPFPQQICKYDIILLLHLFTSENIGLKRKGILLHFTSLNSNEFNILLQGIYFLFFFFPLVAELVLVGLLVMVSVFLLSFVFDPVALALLEIVGLLVLVMLLVMQISGPLQVALCEQIGLLRNHANPAPRPEMKQVLDIFKNKIITKNCWQQRQKR